MADRLDIIDNADEREQRAYLAHRTLFAEWDRFLDQGDHGPTWLKEPAVAQMVTESLHHRDTGVYALICYCVMPNHLHLVFTPLPESHDHGSSVTKIMQALKGYTAYQANALLQRSGQFWQHESYDHWIRDEEELARIVRYVINNPVKARLVDRWDGWPWTYCRNLP